MKKVLTINLLFLLIFAVSLSKAHAAMTYLASPPGSVVEGALEGDNEIFWFFEGQATLNANLPVDITVPGAYSQDNLPAGGTIISGKTVKSYLLHFDPSGDPPSPTFTYGTISFPDPIIGIIVSGNLLSGSDFLSQTGTVYPDDPQWRGLEFGTGSVSDMIVFDDSFGNGLGATTQLEYTSGSGIDQIRILTAVPLPTSVLLLGCGLIGLVGLRRIRR